MMVLKARDDGLYEVICRLGKLSNRAAAGAYYGIYG